MRVKDPSKALSEKGKRNKRPSIPHDEDSSDDIAVGLTCQHVSHAVSVNHVKRAIAENLWSVCSECLKERRLCDGQPVLPSDIWLCLKCGFQGCGKNSESQHSLQHFKSSRTESHCIVINLSTWIIWCYECDEKLSTHCNKKVLAQIVDFLQKHVSKTQTTAYHSNETVMVNKLEEELEKEPGSWTAKDAFSKILKLCEEKLETGEVKKGRKGSTISSVKGITNLGNTCFFNAVIQNLAQTYILFELMNEIKDDGTKFKISPSLDSQLDPLVVELSSPGPLTSALFLFLHSMKETEKGPLSPKVLFNQLCQKAPRFKGFQQQDSQELLHYLLDAVRTEETKRIQASILKAFNNPTIKTADEDTRKKVKAYGKEGVKMNFIDRIFIGELTSTVMCEECANISTVKDPFIDISLPIIEERVSKPVLFGKMSKCRSLQETDHDLHSGPVAIETAQPRAAERLSSPKEKNQLIRDRKHTRKLSGEEKTVAAYQRNGKGDPCGDSPLNESPAEGSCSGSSGDAEDADSEASESESALRRAVRLRPSAEPRVHTMDGRRHLPSRPSGAEPRVHTMDGHRHLPSRPSAEPCVHTMDGHRHLPSSPSAEPCVHTTDGLPSRPSAEPRVHTMDSHRHLPSSPSAEPCVHTTDGLPSRPSAEPRVHTTDGRRHLPSSPSTEPCVHTTDGHRHLPSTSEAPRPGETSSGDGDEGMTAAISELCLSRDRDRDFDRESRPLHFPNNLSVSEEKHMQSHSLQNAFQTLSQSYVTASKECSIQSCLYQFTSMELLMGNNKLLCENCTKKKHKYPKETSSAEKKAEGVYTNARKQLLISAVPVILILHLKRFHQAGLSLRKVNRHVDFPLTLDLAPFCSATCKNVNVGGEVLYGLYGIVEHSGSMRGGHYTAYVKVRLPSRTLSEHITGKKNVPGLKEPDGDSGGHWVYVSDTNVHVVPESRALSAQAYLLFYERIL